MFAIYVGGESSVIAGDWWLEVVYWSSDNILPGTGDITGFYLVTSNVSQSGDDRGGAALTRQPVQRSQLSEEEFKRGKEINSYRLQYIKDILKR